jgi:predicted transcriptional regulator
MSKDKGQTLEGVRRQISDAIDRINSTPDVTLNADIEGSLVDPKRPELGHWPRGVLCANDVSARRGGRKKRMRERERLMTYLTSGDVSCVVSQHSARLWRDNLETAEGVEALRDLDVRLIFLTEREYDLSNKDDRMVFTIMGSVNQNEADRASDRQQDATRHAAKAGAYHGARPFGFMLYHVNPDGSVHPAPKSFNETSGICEACEGRKASRYRTLVPHPEEAPALREAYVLVRDDVSPYAVCQYLDGHEIDGPDGTRISRPAIRTAQGKTWEQVGIQGLLVILRAKRNIGVREWSVKWYGGKRPPGELHDAHWDGIVDQPLFDTVQIKLAKRHKTRPGGSAPAHLLTSYTYGGFCGHRLASHVVGGKRRLRCQGWTTSGQCVSFEEAVAEREVELYLYKWLSNNTMLAKALEHTGNTELQELYATRRKHQDQRDELGDKLSDGIIDDETYVRLKNRKDELIAEVTREIDAILASGAAGTQSRSFPTGKAFRTEWSSADLNGKRAIILRFVDKVLIYPAGAGNKPDPRLVQIHPGAWARGIEGAEPPPPPDPASFTSKGKILAYVSEHPGEWFTRGDIATATEVSPSATDKNLKMLGAAGDVAREWTRRDGQRACWLYSAASGESWGPRTRKAPGGAIGAREKIKSFMEASPREWFTASEISAGSDAGGAPHVTRTVNELVTAGFAQRRRAPLPRKNVRYEYSVNGR